MKADILYPQDTLKSMIDHSKTNIIIIRREQINLLEVKYVGNKLW